MIVAADVRVLDYRSDGRPEEGWLARILRKTLGRRAVLVFIDQGVVSAGNFLTGFLVARNVQPLALVGDYGLLMQVVFYVNALQAALVVYPLTVKGASKSREELAVAGGASTIFTLGLAPLAMLVVGIAIAVLQQNLLLGCIVAAAVIAWQVQETVRRALLAHLEYDRALVGDAVRYLGQAAVVLLLVRRHSLSLEAVFATIFAMSFLAAIIQGLQLRIRRPSAQTARRQADEFWELGSWMLGAAALGVITNLAFPFALRFMRKDGADQVGVLTAFGNLLLFVNPVTQSIVGLILPASARAMAAHGLRAAATVSAKAAAMGAVILVPILLAFLIFPHFVVQYGLKQAQYRPYVWALNWCVIAQMVMYLGACVEAFLNSLQKAHSNFIAYIVNSAAVLLIGLPLVHFDGLRGALIGGIICVVVRVLATLYFVRRLHWGGEALAEGEAGRLQAEMDVAGERPILGVE